MDSYSEPAGGGEPQGNMLIVLKLTQDLIYPSDVHQLEHRNALCDVCSSHIVGEWFRCIMCGKDYCEGCESVGEHDPTHVFAVFKSRVSIRGKTYRQLHRESVADPLCSPQVDTHLLGTVVDLTLSTPPPLWPHEVYRADTAPTNQSDSEEE